MSTGYFDNILNELDSNFESKQNSKDDYKETTKINKGNILDSLPSLRDESGHKNHKKFYKGIYFDEDIFKVISDMILTKDGRRRNIQSQIVNDCLREVFNSRNLL